MNENQFRLAMLQHQSQQTEYLRRINENLEKLVTQETPESRLADDLEQELRGG